MKTPLYNFIFRIVRDQTTTHDLVGDTFLKLLEKKAQMESYRNIKNFLYLVGRNLAIDSLRYQGIRHSIPLGEDSSDPLDPEPDPLHAILRTELNNHRTYLYEKAIKLIMNDSHEYAKVFRLYLEGRSTDQIADLLDTSPNTVRNHRRKALKTLAERLLAKGPALLTLPIILNTIFF